MKEFLIKLIIIIIITAIAYNFIKGLTNDFEPFAIGALIFIVIAYFVLRYYNKD